MDPLKGMRRKLWYLNNDHLDFVIMARTEAEAWEKLRKQCGIIRPGSEPTSEYEMPAYNELSAVDEYFIVDNPHDLDFVL